MRDPPSFEKRIRQALDEAFAALRTTRQRPPGEGSTSPSRAKQPPAEPMPPVADEVCSLVRRMLEFSPDDRIKSDELLANEWLRSGCPSEYFNPEFVAPSPGSSPSAALSPFQPFFQEGQTPGSVSTGDDRDFGIKSPPAFKGKRAARHAISRGRSFFSRDPSALARSDSLDFSSPSSTNKSQASFGRKGSKARVQRPNTLELQESVISDGDEEPFLPPITASTPMIGRARKIVQQGAQLVDRWRREPNQGTDDHHQEIARQKSISPTCTG